MVKSNFERLKQIFLYYDSEPMEVLQGFIWIFLFIPITTIEHGFNVLLHPIAFVIGTMQLFCVLNCSLKRRKIVSFLVFLWSIAITACYFLDHSMIEQPIHLVFVFISLFALFNLRRLTIENINTKWIK